MGLHDEIISMNNGLLLFCFLPKESTHIKLKYASVVPSKYTMFEMYVYFLLRNIALSSHLPTNINTLFIVLQLIDPQFVESEQLGNEENKDVVDNQGDDDNNEENNDVANDENNMEANNENIEDPNGENNEENNNEGDTEDKDDQYDADKDEDKL